MKAVKFTYGIEDVVKVLEKWYGESRLRFDGFTSDGRFTVKRRDGATCNVTADTICVAFGGIGGTYNAKGYVKPHVKWSGLKGKKPRLTVWKHLLTWDEFVEVMKRHNKGFKDKGNPKVLQGVIVYSPSASGWKRNLWDCKFIDRAYRCWSNAETFLEVDPSSGLIRHPHCSLVSLRGDSQHGGESLIRPDYSWKVDYCYFEGFAKGDK